MAEQKESRVLELIDELSEAAERVGLVVRREKILREVGYRARGGACRLREKDLIIIGRDESPGEQLETRGEALRSRDLESLDLSPAARRVVQPEPQPG